MQCRNHHEIKLDTYISEASAILSFSSSQDQTLNHPFKLPAHEMFSTQSVQSIWRKAVLKPCLYFANDH